MKTIDVVELSISEMLEALEAGELTSVDLVCAYLNRIAYYDRTGYCLNSVPLINENAIAEAEASDERRRTGQPLGFLEGIPFTVKDSYMVKGMTVASGSPALKDLIATKDAATVEMLRGAGAVVLGKTNMPPMAAGGVQPGVYDYARSPYTPTYLTAGYGSGSSNGSGTATSASFGAFGMAEETLSSGRSPASNNALVAYTPSRGLISIRGNWPLRPTADVVVPHTRTVEDLLRLLDVLVVEDEDVTGDFWRKQNIVELPAVSSVRPETFQHERPERLDGVRLGAPKMYIGEDSDGAEPPMVRRSVRALWDQAAAALEALGATVVPVDFPVVSNYEEDRPGAQGLEARGLVSGEWRYHENGAVPAMALDEFLRANNDSQLNTWADVDGDKVFPLEDSTNHVTTVKTGASFDWQRLAELVKQGLPDHYDEVPGVESLRGLEEARKRDFEDWMAAQDLDGVVFPAAGDVAREDLFSRPESMEYALRNGVTYSNGNRAIRHLGIPTVNVPMGVMADIRMPVNLTFAGAAYSDDRLLDYAWAYENATRQRRAPYMTPSMPSNQIPVRETEVSSAGGEISLDPTISIVQQAQSWEVTVELSVPEGVTIDVWADGHLLVKTPENRGTFVTRLSTSRDRLAKEITVIAKACRADRLTRAIRTTVPLKESL